MSRVYLVDLGQHVGQEVVIDGWLANMRSKGKLHFLTLRDGTAFRQAIMSKKEVSEEEFETCGRAGIESAVRLRGLVNADDRAPGGYELHVKGFELLAEVHDYPIAKQSSDQSGPGPDFLLDRRHLWLRSRKQHAIMRVRHRIAMTIRNFFDERGFCNVDAPIFTPAACEGTTTLFETKYFDGQAYLTQSGQLYMEAAAMAQGKVYCFGPTFRAEKSKTRRHLTEFWMVEPEIAYAGLDDVMQLAEDFLCRIVADVLERCQEELATLERDVSKLQAITGPFPRMSYTEVVERLNAEGHPFEWGGDFGAPDETKIGSWSDKPMMVHRWPKDIKAFYMAPDPENPKVVLGVDVIAPEGKGEIIGGAQRAHDLGYLEDQIAAHGLPREAFEWYLDLRRYGGIPTAGFGLGLERTVAWITGTEHIRECIPFPRTIYRITP
ncbi:MAG: asparagine--tRNA ligase [Planctomycetes bacterium]|nr:asparagine--tRNA ligase [Planctomycetota bacterium]